MKATMLWALVFLSIGLPALLLRLFVEHNTARDYLVATASGAAIVLAAFIPWCYARRRQRRDPDYHPEPVSLRTSVLLFAAAVLIWATGLLITWWKLQSLAR